MEDRHGRLGARALSAEMTRRLDLSSKTEATVQPPQTSA